MARRTPPPVDPYVEKILLSASVHFAEKGYHGTSMRDIAADVGVNAGSLYTHIRSKEELLLAVVWDICVKAQAQMDAIVASDLDAEGKIRRVAREHLELILARPDWSTVYFHEWRHLSPTNRRKVQRSRDKWESGLRTIIAAGVDDGTFHELDVRMAGIAFVGMLNWTYRWMKPEGPLTGAQIADMFADFILGGWRA